MSTVTQLYTAEDLWNMPDNGGHCELVRGELRPMAPANFDHGGVTMNLAIPLGHYIKLHTLGTIVAAETGFIIARKPDTVRAPDIGFVRKERIPPSGRPKKFFDGAPDLAVETLSPYDTMEEVEEKVHDWLAAGTRLVWVVNPRQRTVTVYRPDKTARILAADESLEGDDVVAGFSIDVAEIFG